jgi:transcription-repair coupling factor (superfamily II helicase)
MLSYLNTRSSMNRQIKKTSKMMFFKSSTDTYNAYLCALDFKENQETVFIVTSNLYEAQKYYDTMSQILDPDDVLFYPADQTLTSIMALGSPEFKSERIYTLKQLMTEKPFVVVTTLQGLCQRQLTPEDYQNSVKRLVKGHAYALDKLVQYLVYSGYAKSYTVEKPGEFSIRGHILDIYTLNHSQPYRLDFFDDVLDQIKIFDVETQRSHAEVDRLEIAPMNELFYTDQMKSSAISKITSFFANKSL